MMIEGLNDENNGAGKKPEGMLRVVRILIIIICILSALAGISAAVYHFLLDERLVDRARSEEIYRLTMKRMQDRERIPARDNGFNALAGVTAKNATAAARAPYESLGKNCNGKIADIEKSLTDDKKRTEKDIKNLIRVMPEIQKTVERKYYVIPCSGDFSLDYVMPNFLEMRAISQSLAALGVYREMQKRPEEAVKCYLLAIGYGARIGNSGGLLTQMISVALESIGISPLHNLLAKGKLKKEACLQIIAAIDALPLERDDFLNAMDEEYVRTLNSLDAMIAGKRSYLQPGNINPGKLKFIVKREKNIYMNMHLRYRPCYETLKVPSEMGINVDDDMKALSRKMSFICPVLIPNFSRAIIQKRFTLTRISALKLMAALQSYRIDKGRYPASLNDLCPSYLRELPGDYMSTKGSFIYAAKGASPGKGGLPPSGQDSSFTLISDSELYRHIGMSTPLFYNPPDSKAF
jgi:hypothetical protein